MPDLQERFGPIDIYLFDQILRGRVLPHMRIFDAGCGGGRNLVYLLREGFEVYGADANPAAIAEVRRLASMLAPALPHDHFRVEALESLTFPSGFADFVISSAVLHFARDEAQFQAMLKGTWRTVGKGGVLFSRLASSIGIESQLTPIEGRRYQLPDGSARFLVDEAMLCGLTSELGAHLLDPLKTTVVQNQRSMTTWVVQKPS